MARGWRNSAGGEGLTSKQHATAYLIALAHTHLAQFPVDSLTSVWYTFAALHGGVAEWLKAAVLKTAER